MNASGYFKTWAVTLLIAVVYAVFLIPVALLPLDSAFASQSEISKDQVIAIARIIVFVSVLPIVPLIAVLFGGAGGVIAGTAAEGIGAKAERRARLWSGRYGIVRSLALSLFFFVFTPLKSESLSHDWGTMTAPHILGYLVLLTSVIPFAAWYFARPEGSTGFWYSSVRNGVDSSGHPT
ncbi:MAG: hypothetical protein RMA76_31225 [Deltaproteobacteria bacterium]|jgi:hypothetical protein